MNYYTVLQDRQGLMNVDFRSVSCKEVKGTENNEQGIMIYDFRSVSRKEVKRRGSKF